MKVDETIKFLLQNKYLDISKVICITLLQN